MRRTSSPAIALLALLCLVLGPLGPAQADPDDPAGGPGGGAPGSGSPETGWQVSQVAPDRYRVSWTAAEPLPMTSDRPVIALDGVTVPGALVESDGRTVAVELTADSPPQAEALDVLLSGDRLDEPGQDGARGDGGTGGALPKQSGELVEADPGEPGPYQVSSSDYELDPVKLPGMTEPIEMVGHVVEPTADSDTGARPLVLFLHGRHGVCYVPGSDDEPIDWPCKAPAKEIPSHLGYDYAQRLLASQGYATVSVRVNGINAQDERLDDGGAGARATIVQRHLDHLADEADEHQLDLDRVILVGHSRGGEGVDRASIQIPTDAPYRIVGQVLLAPTNFAEHSAPYVPTVTVLPYCDGDVSDLQGQRFTDISRDLAPGDPALHSSILVMGANHNFFNTEWTPGQAVAPAHDDVQVPDDQLCGKRDDSRLSATEQQDVGKAYLAGAVQLFADGDQEQLPLFDGSDARIASAGDAVVHSHAVGGGRDERRPGVDGQLVFDGTQDVQLCVGRHVGTKPQDCGRFARSGETPHWPEMVGPPLRQALDVGWTSAGASAGLTLDEPLDLTDRRLELRTVVDQSRPSAAVQVRVTDTTGKSAVADPIGGQELQAYPAARGLAKRWARTVAVDPADLDGVDLAAIEQVELVGTSDQGRLFVLDVASAPQELPEVPQTRLPLLQVEDVTIDEGDDPERPGGVSTAYLPITLDGELTEPAKVVVQVDDYGRRPSSNRLQLTLRPGQPARIPVDYRVDRKFTGDQAIFAAVYPANGVATDRYVATLRVRDDEPAPVVSAPKQVRAREGRTAQVPLTVSPVSVHSGLGLVRFAKTPGKPLRIGDLPTAWLKRNQLPTGPASRPLHRIRRPFEVTIRANAAQGKVSIPIRDDGRREPAESVRLDMSFSFEQERQTVSTRLVVR